MQNVVVSHLLKQFFEIKEKYKDAIILFRCGDFYESFNDNAVKVSELLDLKLLNIDNEFISYQLTEFSFEKLDSYLPKLVRAGNRIAICETIKIKEMKNSKCSTCTNDFLNRKEEPCLSCKEDCNYSEISILKQ